MLAMTNSLTKTNRISVFHTKKCFDFCLILKQVIAL